MVDYNEQIKILEDEIRNTQYNKATEHHIGLTKAKIATIRKKQEARSKGKGKTEGYAVRKTGDATAVLIGFPSVGKSTLLNALTNAESKTAAYAFTTTTCIPGLLEYKKAKIQILDMPGIIKGASRGAGRGREVFSVLRTADLVIVIADVFEREQLDTIVKELYDANMRLNQKKPNVRIRKLERGGIQIGKTVKLTKLEDETIKGILNEFHTCNAQVLIREDITPDQLIDVIEGDKKYVPMVLVVNKIDLADEETLKSAKKYYKDAVFISAENRTGIEEVKEAIFQKLDLMRIYLKEVGKEADMEIPLIIKEGATIADVCDKLHRDFIKRFRFAKVWGKSAKFAAQRFNATHALKDGDILQIHLK
ncbi:MAG: GTP-binding protein [Candidatus Woesearchaeota archaeon]